MPTNTRRIQTYPSAAELAVLRERLTAGIKVLAERRRKAAEAALAIGERSRQEAERIGLINDCFL